MLPRASTPARRLDARAPPVYRSHKRNHEAQSPACRCAGRALRGWGTGDLCTGEGDGTRFVEEDRYPHGRSWVYDRRNMDANAEPITHSEYWINRDGIVHQK